jgi:hypothetical protein
MVLEVSIIVPLAGSWKMVARGTVERTSGVLYFLFWMLVT